jgi:hypothetical protein
MTLTYMSAITPDNGIEQLPLANRPRPAVKREVEFLIGCPHCDHLLAEAEIRSILGRFARSKRLSSLGASRFAKMTAEQRSVEGKRAATARWAKHRKERQPA